MSDPNYYKGGELDYWYDYNLKNIFSEDYLIYVFESLLANNQIQLTSDFTILSVGMNRGVYETVLLKYLQHTYVNSHFRLYLYDKDPRFTVNVPGAVRLTSDNFESLGVNFDIIFDLRAGLWYAEHTAFTRKKVIVLLQKYSSLLKSSGNLVIDIASTRKFRDLRVQIKKQLNRIKKDRVLSGALNANILLEESTFEKLTKVLKAFDFYKLPMEQLSQTAFSLCKDERVAKTYLLNAISVVCIQKQL